MENIKVKRLVQRTNNLYIVSATDVVYRNKNTTNSLESLKSHMVSLLTPVKEPSGLAPFRLDRHYWEKVASLPEKSATTVAAGKDACTRCGGKGYMPFPHIKKGLCFRCNGRKIERNTSKQMSLI